MDGINHTDLITQLTDALETAAHELTTLHGLIASDDPDMIGYSHSFEIDTTKTLSVIHAAIRATRNEAEPDDQMGLFNHDSE